jgi:hypothetical protein
MYGESATFSATLLVEVEEGQFIRLDALYSLVSV